MISRAGGCDTFIYRCFTLKQILLNIIILKIKREHSVHCPFPPDLAMLKQLNKINRLQNKDKLKKTYLLLLNENIGIRVAGDIYCNRVIYEFRTSDLRTNNIFLLRVYLRHNIIIN